MPCLPYSQDRAKFTVTEDKGVIHSEMNTPGLQMAYANRRFLKMVNDTGKIGRVAFKPTQAMEDGINSGLLSWMLEGTQFKVGRKYAVDGYVEHRELVDRIIALLPSDFKDGMENWGGQIEQHISDTNYGILLWDLIEQQDCIILATDLDGDRLTDLLADVSDPLRAYSQRIVDHLGVDKKAADLWTEMGYTTGNGRDMTSVMYRMEGPPIHEQTLGSADAMLLRLLDGDESMGGTKTTLRSAHPLRADPRCLPGRESRQHRTACMARRCARKVRRSVLRRATGLPRRLCSPQGSDHAVG